MKREMIMCGIFGYVGPQKAVKMVINGLKKLEYRGYDSAGIAGINQNKIVYAKEVGKISQLEAEVEKLNLNFDLAIAQTRWATHGVPNKVNAHPHFDTNKTLALVHNGIIENYEILRNSLKSQGVVFVSDTDTEVVAHLIASLYQGDIVKATLEALSLLKGAYALALIHKDFPDQILAVAHDAPLIIGIGANEAFVASDTQSFAAHTREVVYLANSELAIVKSNKLEIYNTSSILISKETKQLALQAQEVSKGKFEHFTLKEIYEQPQAVRNAMNNRFLEDYGTAIFEGLNFDVNELLSVQRVLILACGTSWHAGYLAAYMLEDKARIPVQAEISSEFRYKNPIVPQGTLVIAISQSGETADTVAAVKELKAKGARVLAICNVEGSTITREADSTIFLHAGPEIGVCSTKAFTSQVVVLSLFTLMMARMRHMNKQEGQEFLSAIRKLPDQIQAVLDQAAHIEAIAKKYAHYENFFFLGRHYMYPSALEGALKLKEIAYINANGYPAGEMKHGPIALINEDCPTIGLCANKLTADKLISNLMEVKARKGLVIAIAEKDQKGLSEIADDSITIPNSIDEMAAIPTVVATQLFAYYAAKERGADIDQPRNLAKSVTVE